MTTSNDKINKQKVYQMTEVQQPNHADEASERTAFHLCFLRRSRRTVTDSCGNPQPLAD